MLYLFPVRTRRCFDVHTTLWRLHGRQNDVTCLLRINRQLLLLLFFFFNQSKSFDIYTCPTSCREIIPHTLIRKPVVIMVLSISHIFQFWLILTVDVMLWCIKLCKKVTWNSNSFFEFISSKHSLAWIFWDIASLFFSSQLFKRQERVEDRFWARQRFCSN